MITRSTILHLRIPFSFFLLPVFLFALAITPNLDPERIIIVFVALHFFLYPASNGYNSYFDKDEESIGGLRNPPPVSKDLYWAALIFDGIAIGLGFMINWKFALMLFIYGVVSKMYSHPSVRLKKYPYMSWFIAGLFQGCFTFLMAYLGLNNFGFENIIKVNVLFPALLSSLILWGSYPMTQVYQHEEDSKRGDHTLSIVLGIKGTFFFTAIMFTLATLAFTFYFISHHTQNYAYAFVIFLFPVIAYFSFWFLKVIKDNRKANFTYTMWLNFISSVCLNLFFIYLFLTSTNVLDAIKDGY